MVGELGGTVAYTGKPEALIDGFQGATEPLETIEGFSQAYFLVDRANNRGMSITMWESEEALLASAARADELRKGATEPSGSTIESVEHYEIALTAGAKSSAVGSSPTAAAHGRGGRIRSNRTTLLADIRSPGVAAADQRAPQRDRAELWPENDVRFDRPAVV